MIRRAFSTTALTLALLACSFGGTGAVETQPPSTPSSAGGGVPISKATAAEGVQAPEATSVPPTQAPSQPPTQPPTAISGDPESGQLPIAVTDFNIIGTADFPRLIGIVKNESQIDLFDVSLTITFYNADGSIADTRFGPTFMTTLPSGELSPFEFVFPRGVPASVEAVGASVEWQEVYPGYAWSRDGFSVLSPQGSMGSSNFEITGQLQNSSGKTARSVNIVAVAYNAAGHIIGFGLKVLDSIAAGSNVQFEMAIAAGTSLAEPQVDHFELLVEGLLEG